MIMRCRFVLFLLLSLSSPSFAGDFLKGLTAAQVGDYGTALREFKPLAEEGNYFAQHNLGVMYDNGYGVPQNYKTAVKWYTLAAEQGYGKAQTNLGVSYVLGQGVLQDNIYAHMWFNVAASLGEEEASKYREKVAERMTPVDISKAQQLARDCVAKDYKGC